MASKEKYKGTIVRDTKTVPFNTVEEAWFWFITAQQAKNDGVRYAAGIGLIPRPCEPVDILKIVDTLYRKRYLLRSHLLVLRHYGLRNLPPDSRRVREVRAHEIWAQAMDKLEPILIKKGIVREQHWVEKYAGKVICLDDFRQTGKE